MLGTKEQVDGKKSGAFHNDGPSKSTDRVNSWPTYLKLLIKKYS